MAKTAKEQLGVDLPETQIEAPEVEEKEEVVEDQRPEWLPENFKDEHELLKAYNEAQNKIREQGRANNELERQFNELRETIDELVTDRRQPQQQAQGYDQEQILNAYEQDPLGTIAWLAQQQAQAIVSREMEQFKQQTQPQIQQSQRAQHELMAIAADQALSGRHDDWQDYKGRVAEAINNDPTLLPETALTSPEATTAAIERVYKFVKAEDVLQGKVQVNNDRMKQQAQTVSGAQGRPGAPDENQEKIERLKAAATQMSYAAFRSR